MANTYLNNQMSQTILTAPRLMMAGLSGRGTDDAQGDLGSPHNLKV